jgi:cyclophilin family peptidyl-prolyl cis-trans isomerase
MREEPVHEHEVDRPIAGHVVAMFTSPLRTWRMRPSSTRTILAASIAPVKRLAPLVLVCVCLLAACGGGGKSGAGTTTSKAGCEDATSKAHNDRHLANEHLKLDPSKSYRLVFATNCGDFTVTLDQKASPNATASLVSLAKRGFFDDTFFHRIVPGFVIQGGDPTGTGSGGPAYQTHDKVAADASYVHGVVAMAKAGAEPPGTAGSQFFVVTGADAQLPPEYAVVGKVTRGIDVVDRIGKLGDPSTEQPTRAVVIDHVSVES